jgi:hypothetical protein
MLFFLLTTQHAEQGDGENYINEYEDDCRLGCSLVCYKFAGISDEPSASIIRAQRPGRQYSSYSRSLNQRGWDGQDV